MDEDRVKVAKKVTWVGFWVNLLLVILKIIAGILGKSSAMLADGIHSFSDFLTDIIVIAFVGISGKASDDNHDYGHGKYETFATLLISVMLFVVGVGISWGGVSTIIKTFQGEVLEAPGILALVAAACSIVFKEVLYHYTIIKGKKIDSQAVIANAWHHRSDAFSSIGTALGISGAIFLGESWRILDPLAGIIVSFFIIKVAYVLCIPSIQELLESSLPLDMENEIVKIITSNEQIITYHHLRTRRVGSNFVIDVHIKLDRNISFVASHDIASDIEQRLRKRYGEGTYISIHAEPYPKD